MKIREGHYLIGNRMQALEISDENELILSDKLVSLEDYLSNFGVIECLQIDKKMLQTKLEFKELVVALLVRYKME